MLYTKVVLPISLHACETTNEINVIYFVRSLAFVYKVARRNLPAPCKLLCPLKSSNFWQSANVSRKLSFVLGSHVARRGGTQNFASF